MKLFFGKVHISWMQRITRKWKKYNKWKWQYDEWLKNDYINIIYTLKVKTFGKKKDKHV